MTKKPHEDTRSLITRTFSMDTINDIMSQAPKSRYEKSPPDTVYDHEAILLAVENLSP